MKCLPANAHKKRPFRVSESRNGSEAIMPHSGPLGNIATVLHMISSPCLRPPCSPEMSAEGPKRATTSPRRSMPKVAKADAACRASTCRREGRNFGRRPRHCFNAHSVIHEDTMADGQHALQRLSFVAVALEPAMSVFRMRVQARDAAVISYRRDRQGKFMKKAFFSLLVAAVVMLAGSGVMAAERTFDIRAGKLSVDIPDGWTEKGLSDGCRIDSADGKNSMTVRIIVQKGLSAMDMAKKIADSVRMTIKNADREDDTAALWGEANGNQMAVFVATDEDMAITAIVKGPEVITMATVFSSVEVE